MEERYALVVLIFSWHLCSGVLMKVFIAEGLLSPVHMVAMVGANLECG